MALMLEGLLDGSASALDKPQSSTLRVINNIPAAGGRNDVVRKNDRCGSSLSH